MILYYKENNSNEYLSIDTSLTYDGTTVEGRATCIKHDINSVNTTTISVEYLQKNCTKVNKKDVPKKWLDILL